MNIASAPAKPSISYIVPITVGQPGAPVLPPPTATPTVPSPSSTTSSALPGPDGVATPLRKRQRDSLPPADLPRESKCTDLLKQAMERDRQQVTTCLQRLNGIGSEQHLLASWAPQDSHELEDLVQPRHQTQFLAVTAGSLLPLG